MEDLIEIITSKGDKVYLKSKLNYGENRMITKFIASKITIDPVTQKTGGMNAASMMEASDKALEMLLVKIELADGTVVSNPLEAINGFDSADGELVLSKADEIYKNANPSKKNETPLK